MKRKITVSVGDVQRSVAKRGFDNHEKFIAAVNAELKHVFEAQGIRFYDKPGLYPLPPGRLTSQHMGVDRIITISQDIDDE